MALIVRNELIHVDGILFLDDRDCYHAAVPSLEVVGYGYTRKEAMDSLGQVMHCYFEEMLKRGALPAHIRRQVCPEDMEDVFACIRSGTGVYNITCTIQMPQPAEEC